MPVYLLHSTVALSRSNGQRVSHYLGWCKPGGFPHRLREHQMGRHSATIVQAMVEQGAELLLGNYWPEATYEQERQMKRNGHLPSKCLVCRLIAVGRALGDRVSIANNSPSTLTGASDGHASSYPLPSTPDAPTATDGS